MSRFLQKCRIRVKKDSYTLSCSPLNSSSQEKNKTIVFFGSKEGFAGLLRRIKAKDDYNNPPTKKTKTYIGMVNDAISGEDNLVYVWSNLIPKQIIIKENTTTYIPLQRVMRKFSKLTESNLSSSEALFGFVGWITSRDKPIIASSHHEAGEWAGMISDFCDAHDLEEPKDDWVNNLVVMEDYVNNKKDMKEATETFNIYIGDKKIDTVSYGGGMDVEEVRTILINNKGYNSDIKVVKESVEESFLNSSKTAKEFIERQSRRG